MKQIIQKIQTMIRWSSKNISLNYQKIMWNELQKRGKWVLKLNKILFGKI